MIIIAGTATAKIDAWDAALAAIRGMEAASEAETGCLSYRIYVAPGDDSRFFIFYDVAQVTTLGNR